MFTMRLDAIRIRVMMMSAGLLTVLIFLIASGRIGGRPHGMIAIEWGAYPEAFAGLDVEVDGQVVGKLTYLGARAASGFEVAEGPHEVRVVGPKWRSVPRKVEVRRDHTSRFMLDVQESVGADGQTLPALVLQ
jgi:hypothetical protein